MVSQRHNYGDDPSQYGVLYGEGPVAVLIHGGFWKAEYGLDLNEALSEDLAERGWAGETPLWFYILKEAELPPYNGERLGPVGGRIMAEVLVGLLQRDPNSYLYLNAAWKPAPPIAPAAGQFGFVDLLR